METKRTKVGPFQPKLRTRRGGSLMGMLICASATFLLLPFTTLITGGASNKDDVRTVEVSLPPPPPPPPEVEPPPEEPPPEQEQPPEPAQSQPLSLAQLDVALNPGFGDAMAGGFNIDNFTQTSVSAAEELQIFDVQDLDKPPARTKTVTPVYPPELKRAKVQGAVVLLIIIDTSGRVTVDKVLESTAREFTQSAVTAAEQCLFEPPMKGGQAVRARYRMQVTFRL